jgi:crotonobetainyl-CoA:carnitine CoA-transferase CaiB-like acyl-CoA transferase
MTGPLSGLRVFDMTRILAGPTCTQILGDLGADVIKVERPGSGDDTRRFGPPFLKDDKGKETAESAYFLSSNRNKRSITLDITKPEGQDLARRLIARSDILVENFKFGDLARYGLSYEQLKVDCPGLVYCSITGFGQTGPAAAKPGYDVLIQGMGGFMSLTGEPDGAPQKAGVPIADLMAGMYAAVAINAALRHREVTGEGQYIDIGMLDTQVAMLSIQGLNYLATGQAPARLGNAHPNIVPYQTFATADGDIILAVGKTSSWRSATTRSSGGSAILPACLNW